MEIKIWTDGSIVKFNLVRGVERVYLERLEARDNGTKFSAYAAVVSSKNHVFLGHIWQISIFERDVLKKVQTFDLSTGFKPFKSLAGVFQRKGLRLKIFS